LYRTTSLKMAETTGKWEVQLRKGGVELAILATLWPGKLYGLEMVRRLRYCSGLTVSEGTIYPLLSRLETAGLVEPEWVETGQAHPRKYYSLTVDGRTRTLVMAQLWTRFTGNIDQLLEPVRRA
jgi:PadR family transcriptional regulator PadR